MAAREFLEEQLEGAMRRAEDKTRPQHERAAARMMADNCRSRLLALRGRDEETSEDARLWSTPAYPGHIGYVERSALPPTDAKPSDDVVSLPYVRDTRKRAAYADLVMQAFDAAEHVGRRDARERRAAVERAGKRRL